MIKTKDLLTIITCLVWVPVFLTTFWGPTWLWFVLFGVAWLTMSLIRKLLDRIREVWP